MTAYVNGYPLHPLVPWAGVAGAVLGLVLGVREAVRKSREEVTEDDRT
jgi:hypothetical protein